MKAKLLSLPLMALLLAPSVWIAADLARLTWIVAGTSPGKLPPPMRGPVVGAAAEPVDVEKIIGLAPFGSEAPTMMSGDSASLITLQGVILATDPARSQAIIGTPAGKPRRYMPGETLPGGAVLVRVESARIVLQSGGREQALAFPGAHRSADGQSRPPAPPIVTPPGSAPAAASPARPIDEVIGQARQALTENPKAYLNRLGVEPGADGYHIAGAATSFTRQAGLRPGDIVSRVNGMPLGDLEADRQRFDSIVASGVARIEVMRDGQPIILTFPLK